MAATQLNSRSNLFFVYITTILCTPFFLTRFAFDILLCLPPWTRPVREWSVNQAVRVRFVRLVLLYTSRLRAGNSLSLRSGREGKRFEVIRPQASEFYKGPLLDNEIRPEPIGTTWTPAQPPQAVPIPSDLIVALHYHGGAFSIGDGRDGDTGYLARTLLRYMGCTHVCSPQYRLADGKDGRFPAALQDAVTTYVYLIKEKGIPAQQIILSGDSAGANLALGLLRYIHEHGKELNIPPPRAVALWSPWVDVGAAIYKDLSKSPNYSTDYLNKEFGRWGATSVSGYGVIDPRGPYLSPLNHPFKLEAEIPMFVQAGEREVICDDIKLMAQRYENLGWNLKLVVSENCPHDILLLGPMIRFRDEARAAAREAGRFLSATTGLQLRVVDEAGK